MSWKVTSEEKPDTLNSNPAAALITNTQAIIGKDVEAALSQIRKQ